jgi:hypothetical protein
LTHKKELQKERNYKLSRNISKENASQPATDAEKYIEGNLAVHEPLTNVTTIRLEEYPQLITTSAIIHNSTQTRSTETESKHTCLKTLNSVNKYSKLSLKKTQESRKLNITKTTHVLCKQNDSSHSVINSSITKPPTHQSKECVRNETHVLSKKSRLGTHRVSNPNHNDDKHLTDKSENTPVTMVHTNDQNIAPMSTSNLSDNIGITDNMDHVFVSCKQIEKNVQQRQSNCMFNNNKTGVRDTWNVSTQEYSDCMNPWTSQDVPIPLKVSPSSARDMVEKVESSVDIITCQNKIKMIPHSTQTELNNSHPVTESSSRKRPFKMAFDLNLTGVTSSMITNAIHTVKATKNS